MSLTNSDVAWIANNVEEWKEAYDRVCVFLYGGVEFFNSKYFPGKEGMNREEWESAREHLADEGKSVTWSGRISLAGNHDLADERINNIARNGNDGDHYPSPEDTDIWADAPDDAEYYGTVSKRFYKLIAGIPCSALSWNDQRNFWQFTIMPTDEFEGPGFIKRPPDDQAMPADLEPLAQSGNDGIVCSTINGKTITGNTYGYWQHLTDDITAYDPPGPTTMPECTFTTPDEEEAWREVEKKIYPVWQSPHDAGGVCVFHGCRYAPHEQCPMCVLAGEAAKEEAKQPAYNPEDVAFVRAEGKQPRYQDDQGEDWIDEAARTFTPEEFRGAMRFSIGKYNRRMGKKDDLVKEIEKMRDYCQRWIDVEKGR